MITTIKVQDSRIPNEEFVLIEAQDFNEEFHKKLDAPPIPTSPMNPTEPEKQLLLDAKIKNSKSKEVGENG